MTPAPDDRDPVVAEALDRLAPPDPSPAFWSRLDDELRQVAPGRGSWRPGWPALAAAAVVVLAALAAVALAGRGEDPAPVADPTSTTSTPTTSTTSITDTTAVTPPGEPASAADAVLAWVDALHAGDDARAAALLAPNSAQWAAQQSGTAEAFMIQLHEGYGPWVTSPDRTVQTTTVVSSGEGSVEAVVLTGTVDVEGMREFRSSVLPVRFFGGTYRLEPFDYGEQAGSIEFVSPNLSPEGKQVIPRDEAIQIVASRTPHLTIRLDDEEPLQAPTDAEGSYRFAPAGGFSPGEHVLLAVSVGPDHLTAAVIRFTVP
jgi:hypothetical protein